MKAIVPIVAYFLSCAFFNYTSVLEALAPIVTYSFFICTLICQNTYFCHLQCKPCLEDMSSDYPSSWYISLGCKITYSHLLFKLHLFQLLFSRHISFESFSTYSHLLFLSAPKFVKTPTFVTYSVNLALKALKI